MILGELRIGARATTYAALVFTYLFDKKHLLLSKFRVPNIITVGNTRVVCSADFGEESRLPTGE